MYIMLDGKNQQICTDKNFVTIFNIQEADRQESIMDKRPEYRVYILQ